METTNLSNPYYQFFNVQSADLLELEYRLFKAYKEMSAVYASDECISIKAS